MVERFADRVYQMVRRIPVGYVTTYGAIATLIYSPRAARAVGGALKVGDWGDVLVPWQRVVNASGQISARGDSVRAELQRLLLEREGVIFDPLGGIDLKRFGWWG